MKRTFRNLIQENSPAVWQRCFLLQTCNKLLNNSSVKILIYRLFFALLTFTLTDSDVSLHQHGRSLEKSLKPHRMCGDTMRPSVTELQTVNLSGLKAALLLHPHFLSYSHLFRGCFDLEKNKELIIFLCLAFIFYPSASVCAHNIWILPTENSSTRLGGCLLFHVRHFLREEKLPSSTFQASYLL